MKTAVIDGHSTGRALTAALRARGRACVHVQTSTQMADFFTRGFRSGVYEALLDGSGALEPLAQQLAELGVEQVVAGTESGVFTADSLSHLMGLPGNCYETLPARRDKRLMAEVAAAAGVAVPQGAAFTDADAAAAWFTTSGLSAAVVKPPTSAGTDNVRFCGTKEEVHDACKIVLNADNIFGHPNTSVMVQERVYGVEYYANTVSYDGVHRFAEIWRYTKRAGSVGHPVYDYEEPVSADTAEAAVLREFVVGALGALGIVSGAAHTEVMLTERGPVLIETGARLGGGTAPEVVERYAGTSQTRLLADTLMDPAQLVAFDDASVTWTGGLRNVALINPTAGIVRSLDWTQRLLALPTLVHLSHGVTVGQYLSDTSDLINSPGYVFLAAADPRDIERDYRALRAMEEKGLYTR
ncbi:hypothetical protein [Streptomyces sp. NBC_01207]|uniref:hypothetical protein n=1 Tax=Streptomyces sp. NBC_01207 TaxID=2903772 RepID=UPI002E115381|nr:hypothetical protein OG457_48875 [Streptomyces sp. NBC_01207]